MDRPSVLDARPKPKETRSKCEHRQRMEIRQLQNESQLLLKKNKSVSKSEAKKIIKQWEEELAEKHKRELEVYDQETSDDTETAPQQAPRGTEDDQTPLQMGMYKQRKPTRRDRRAQKRLREREEAARLVDTMQDTEADAEWEAFERVLQPQGLCIHLIRPDGSCLFRSVLRQAELNGLPVPSVKSLRNQVAEYIEEHKDEYLPIILVTRFEVFEEEEEEVVEKEENEEGEIEKNKKNKEGGEDNNNDDDDLSEGYKLKVFQAYLRELRNSLWGGEMEIAVLCKLYGCRICVHHADGRATVYGSKSNNNEKEEDKEEENDDDDDEGLVFHISYHLHQYVMGEHYNSVEPIE